MRGALGSLEASWEKEDKARLECWSSENCRGKSQREESLRLVVVPERWLGRAFDQAQGLEADPSTRSH